MKLRLFSALALFGALVACSDNSTGPDQGRIAVRLTDAPFPLDEVQSIDMFIVRVEAKLASTTEADADEDVEDGDASSDGWVVLATPNASFDLMDLQNGVNVLLGDASVTAGSYQSIRLILDTGKSSVTLKNGMTLSGTSSPSILFPSAGKSGIKVIFSTPISGCTCSAISAAPAATMKTVSHVPLVCCMVLAIGTSSAAVPLAV